MGHPAARSQVVDFGSVQIRDLVSAYRAMEPMAGQTLGGIIGSGDCVVACLTPPMPTSKLQVSGLDSFLRKLPDLDDDIDAFSGDVEAIRRELPPETDPWA